MKIGIIGLGNLGKALLEGLLFSGDILVSDIMGYARTADKQKSYEIDYNIQCHQTIKEVIDKSDVIIIVLKKHIFRDLSPSFLNLDNSTKTIVSLMAGVSIQELWRTFSNADEIIRLMPNLSINKGNGVIAHTLILDKALMNIITKLGNCYLVEEDMIENFTVISASGLGFAAYFLKVYKDIVLEYGLTEEAATKITASIFNEASQAENVEELIESVATTGGITEAGILSFNNNGLKNTIRTGLKDAINKASES